MIHLLAEYAAVAAVFCALSGLGTVPARFLERAHQPPRLLRLPLLAVSGWGLVALLSAIGALADLDQTWLARGALALGLLLLVPRGGGRRTAQRHLLCDLAVLVVLVAPMGLLVAGTPAMAFDEFAQWLPNTRYLVEQGHYWNWPDWQGLSSKPGYPNASAVIALLAGQLTGADVEAPFKTFVVILLGAFGASLGSLAAGRFFADPARPWTGRLSTVALLAGGCLIAILDPFMDPRIAFTAYTDTPSAIIVAIAVLAASYGITAARRAANANAAAWSAWIGLLSLTLVLLRQTNLVLVGAIAGGAGLFLLSRRAGALHARIRWACLMVVPPAIGELVWAIHLSLARIGPDIAPRPFGSWDWSAPLTVARAFIRDRLAGNPLLGGAALAIGALAIVGASLAWRRLVAGDENDGLPPPRVMVSLTAIVGGCFVAFLAWSYIAVFSAEEVAAAASLWRYLGELGPMIVMAGCCVALCGMRSRRWNGFAVCTVAAVGIALLVLLPVAGHGYYRLDCRFPDVAAARAAVARLRPALAPFAVAAPHPARVAVVNPTMGDWMAYALAFDMRWPASSQLVRFRVESEPLAATEDWAWDQGLDAVLDFTPLDRAALRARSTIPAVALLGRPAAKGDRWPILATTHARPPPACSAWRD